VARSGSREVDVRGGHDVHVGVVNAAADGAAGVYGAVFEHGHGSEMLLAAHFEGL
jgi:hypothetical protein